MGTFVLCCFKLWWQTERDEPQGQPTRSARLWRLPPWGEHRFWGEQPPLSGRTPTYVFSLLPAAPPPCRQRAGSPLRRRSPSPPCTRCCIPRASRRWLAACSRSSTLLRTLGPHRCKPCGEQNQALLLQAPRLLPSLYLMKAGACPRVRRTLLLPCSRGAAGPGDQRRQTPRTAGDGGERWWSDSARRRLPGPGAVLGRAKWALPPDAGVWVTARSLALRSCLCRSHGSTAGPSPTWCHGRDSVAAGGDPAPAWSYPFRFWSEMFKDGLEW